MTAVFTQYDEVGSRGSRDGLVPEVPAEPDGEVIEVALVGSETNSVSSTVTGDSGVPVPSNEL